MKKNKIKNAFLSELKRVPIVEVACSKVGVSRQSVYRWRNADDTFRKDMETALAEGEALVNDMTESQLLSLIQDQEWSAISFWLKHRHPKFRNRLEITATIDDTDDVLTAEQEAVVRKALELANITKNSTDKNDY